MVLLIGHIMYMQSGYSGENEAMLALIIEVIIIMVDLHTIVIQPLITCQLEIQKLK